MTVRQHIKQARIRGQRAVELRKARISQHPICRYCLADGRITATNEIDHIIPLSEGGTDTDDNVQGLCFECHRFKTGGHKKPRIGLDGWPTQQRP